MSLRGRSFRASLAVLTVLSVLVWAGSCGQESGAEDAVPEEVAADVPALETVEPTPGDPDGDGFDTQTELAYGTDPNNAASHPPDLDGDPCSTRRAALGTPILLRTRSARSVTHLLGLPLASILHHIDAMPGVPAKMRTTCPELLRRGSVRTDVEWLK